MNTIAEIEIWEAADYLGEVGEGRTRPLRLRCERHTDARPSSAGSLEGREFIVKSLGHPHVFPDTLFRELFGNVLARACGLVTPTPAIIRLSPAFVQLARSLSPDIALRPGAAVGCEALRPLLPYVPDIRLNSVLAPQAALMLAFDLWASNPDRCTARPNCALHDGKLVAYDFDCAFTPSNSRGWEVSATGIAGEHVFKHPLRDLPVDWEPFLAALRTLDEARMRQMVKDVPREWLAGSDRIFDRLLEGCEHPSKLLHELEKCLRGLD